MDANLQQQLENAVQASYSVALLSTEQKNAVLEDIAQALVENAADILAANKKDLQNFDPSDSKHDRALLSEERIAGIAADTRNVIALPDPIGEVLDDRTLENGLELQRIRVPLGVLGIIFESRPNVTVDAAVLSFKAGNVVLLRGGSDCYTSNLALVKIMQSVLEKHGIDRHAIQLLEPDRALVKEMLHAVDYIDVIIPRGGQGLINFVRQEASVPVIETGAGVVHTYVDEFADVQKAVDIVVNGKVRRPSVCNALDTLVIHAKVLEAVLMGIAPLLADKEVEIFADEASLAVLEGKYPEHLLQKATEESFGIEYLSMKMSIKTVQSIDEAIDHVRSHTSKHSEAIVTEDEGNQERYIKEIDAAAVFTNTSTCFTDGAQFGLGAEIGISTQKLHARGPMALSEMTSYKWVVRGSGQTRA